MQRILVAVDGSDHAHRALGVAGELGASLDATLIILTVDEPGPLKGEVAEYAKTEDLGRGQVLDKVLNAAVTTVKEKGATKVETQIGSGDVVEEILEAAARTDAQMIILGARGLSVWQGLILGSVSNKVLHLTSLPCLIVRE